MVKSDWTPEKLQVFFSNQYQQCINLMLAKNHDYGNSWFDDRATTITDTMRHKLDRIRNIEDLRANGDTQKVSEGIEQELRDIINYAVFRIIKEYELDE